MTAFVAFVPLSRGTKADKASDTDLAPSTLSFSFGDRDLLKNSFTLVFILAQCDWLTGLDSFGRRFGISRRSSSRLNLRSVSCAFDDALLFGKIMRAGASALYFASVGAVAKGALVESLYGAK